MNSRGTAVYLNGKLLPASGARISALDRGFLYGDGLFETVRSYRGRIFALREHIARLATSCQILGLPVPRVDWEESLDGVLRRNELQGRDAWVRITVSRGPSPPDLRPPSRPTPTVLVTAGPVPETVRRLQARGARVILLPFARDGFLSEHKTLDYLPAVIGKAMAARRRAFEALYVTSRGRVTEGTTSNVFAVFGHRLLTPPASGILAGITRKHILSLAERAGLEPVERVLTTAALEKAEEVFLTSTIVEVLPVVAIDGKPVGTGKVGEATRRLQEMFRRAVAAQLFPPGSDRA